MTKLSSDEMIAKYGMNNAPDPNNLHVMAMDDGPRVVAELFNWRPGADVNELFDAARCPELYTIATKAHRELRAAMAEGAVEYVDASDDPYDADDVDDAAMLVHFVGSPGVIVVRPDAVDMFSAMYKATWQVTARRTAQARCAVRLRRFVTWPALTGGHWSSGRIWAASSC